MIQWFAQEHPASCVAACLRMVLSSFGTTCLEPEIRQLLGNPRFGLTLQEATEKLLEHGAIAAWYGDWGLNDLRDGVRSGAYPIVGIERRHFGHSSATHAVVVINMGITEIELLDPLLGPAPLITLLDTFAIAWGDAGQEALLLINPIPA